MINQAAQSTCGDHYGQTKAENGSEEFDQTKTGLDGETDEWATWEVYAVWVHETKRSCLPAASFTFPIGTNRTDANVERSMWELHELEKSDKRRIRTGG